MVSLKDIAAATGVSITTVSLVLNGKGKSLRISELQERRIRETAHRMHYTRNQIARSMVTGHNDVIALVGEGIACGEYFYELTSGVLQEASARNYALKLCVEKKLNSDELMRQLIGQQVAGVIFHNATPNFFNSAMQLLDQEKIPYGTLNGYNTANHGFAVDSDDAPGIAAAVRLLCDTGHRHILYLTLDTCYHSLTTRAEAFTGTIAEYPAVDARIFTWENDTPDELNLARLGKILGADAAHRPTAVMAYSDSLALEAFKVAYRLGLSVPGELALVGFSGLTSGQAAPRALTTVIQPLQAMGSQAAKRLFEAIAASGKNPLSPHAEFLPVTLAIRETTAALRAKESVS